VVEAQAPDGLIEAYRHDGPAFMLAVQWHPEWKVRENPFYLAIFRAFGDACRARAAGRTS
jgi:putative glutamine amidotransferase